MAAQSPAKPIGNGGGKADASAGGDSGFDAIFTTLLAGRTADTGGDAAAGSADAAAGAQTKAAQPQADTTSPAAKQLLQALNASASSTALASANAARQDPSAEPKPGADGQTTKDGKAKTTANDTAQIHVSQTAIAKASDNAKAQAAAVALANAPALQDAAGDAGQAADKKTAKTAGNTDHTGKNDKHKKTDNSAADQTSAALLAALGVPAPQTAAPQDTIKTAKDIIADATAPKAKPAAGSPQDAGATGDAAAQTGAATPGAPSAPTPQTAANTPDPNTAAPKAGEQAKTAPTATSAQNTSAQTALQDVLAALGARSAPVSNAPVAQDGAHDKTKPTSPANKAALASAAGKSAHGNAQTPQGATPAAPGQAAAAANDGTNTASDHGGDGTGTSAHHGPEGHVASAKPAPQIPQAAFQLPQHGSTATDPTAAAPFAMQASANGASGQVAAQLHVAAQSAAQAQQAVPANDFGALALNIAAHSQNGTQHFSIALHPADLGHIHVQLSVDHSGAAQAHLSADSQQTLQLLQQNGHHLERALKDTGFNLAGGGLNFSLKGQQQQNTGGQSGQGRGRTLSVSAVASSGSAAETAAASTQYNLAPGSVRLDIHV